MEEAEKLSDMICILNKGKMLTYDSVSGIKTQAHVGYEVTFKNDEKETI